jgi:adenosylhomocysteine nucleosidase
MKFRCLILFVCLLRPLHAEPVEILLVATEAELQPLRSKLSAPRTETYAAWTFWTGTLAGKTVTLGRTDGDPLNAVAATTLGIRHFAPKLVVTFGAARAHDPALHSGDLVVSEKFAAFDGMVSPVTPIGGGSNPLLWQILPHAMMTAGEQEKYTVSFPADAHALAVARGLSIPRGRIIVGVLGSADQINREADRIAWIHQQWGTSCGDTESAHIAGCAQLLGVPVIGLRVIDGVDGAAASIALQFLEAWK